MFLFSQLINCFVKMGLSFKIQSVGLRQIEGILRQYFYELPPSGLATNGDLN